MSFHVISLIWLYKSMATKQKGLRSIFEIFGTAKLKKKN